MNNHFYAVLPCDSSHSYFGNNTVAEFTTKLPQPISLDGSYEVALVELIYTHSFYNVKNSSGSLFLEIKKNDDSPAIKIYAESGHYADEKDFALKLSEKINAVIHSVPDLVGNIITFTFNERRRRLALQLHCINNMSMYMSEPMTSKFGFVKDGPYINGGFNAKNIFDIRAGQRLMYVYCDVASYIPVGETKSPLLRICNVSGKFGDTIHHTFSRPFYVPVSRNNFDTILINIRDELGQPMPFEFGKSAVTLHFRRMNNFAP